MLPPLLRHFLPFQRAALLAALAITLSWGHVARAQAPLQLTATPALIPAFDSGIRDYVVRGDSAAPVQLSFVVPSGSELLMDGLSFTEGLHTSHVSLEAGQSVPVTLRNASSSVTYHIRRLPSDFPIWTTERFGIPQAEWYIVTPSIRFTALPPQNFVTVFDGHGVPVWWYKSLASPSDAKLLPDGNFAWTTDLSFESHRLDGSPVPVPLSPERTIDGHEVQLLPNGNYLLITLKARGPYDLAPLGGSPRAYIIDNIVEEVTPEGATAWYWSSLDNIQVAESDTVRFSALFQSDPSDPYHMNAIEWDKDGYVISYRHLDAVIKVNKATKAIVWKLGGTPRPESLTFQGDPYGNFGGQHDSRILADGTLALQDNGSMRNRPPRAVRYRLDLAAKTATLLEQVTDPEVPNSVCCGGARKLPEGNWVMSWGASNSVTEISSLGDRVFRLKFGDYSSYRVDPVSYGRLDRSALRGGMDAQFPRLYPPANGLATTATQVTAFQSPSNSGSQVTVTARVRGAAGNAKPTGAVQFLMNGNNVGSPVTLDASGQASYTSPPLEAGQYEITAGYIGDGRFNPSTGTLHGGLTIQTPTGPGKGDLNRDLRVNVADAVVALQMSVGILPVFGEDLQLGDMDANGAINVTDAVAILRMAVGL